MGLDLEGWKEGAEGRLRRAGYGGEGRLGYSGGLAGWRVGSLEGWGVRLVRLECSYLHAFFLLVFCGVSRVSFRFARKPGENPFAVFFCSGGVFVPIIVVFCFSQ